MTSRHTGPNQQIKTTEICSDYAFQLSQDGPAQSSALLKNVDNVLPLSAAGAGSIAVIGPNANYSQGDAGYYGPSNVCNGKFWNMVDAVTQHSKTVTTALGVPGATSSSTAGIPAAVRMAKAADTVVLVVGTDLNWAAEGQRRCTPGPPTHCTCSRALMVVVVVATHSMHVLKGAGGGGGGGCVQHAVVPCWVHALLTCAQR